MIIGVSGCQGQGKTTLIRELEKTRSNVIISPVQTARELLAEWDYTLDEVNKYLPLKIKFQEQLLHLHACNLDEHYVNHKNYSVLVERTFADIFVYALASVGPFNEYSEWLDKYAMQCCEQQERYFDKVVFLSGRDYIPEQDGVRSINQHYTSLVDHLIDNYTYAFSKNVVNIDTPYLHDRITALSDVIDDMEK